MRAGITARLADCWHSFRALPAWVQVWVAGILVPVNAAGFALLDTPAGRWTAIAAAFVVATNVPIMLAERGMSRLMSVPHLVAWIPLEIALAARWLQGWGGGMPQGAERLLIAVVLVVNAISLAFDALDSWRWLRGKRAIPGRDPAANA